MRLAGSVIAAAWLAGEFIPREDPCFSATVKGTPSGRDREVDNMGVWVECEGRSFATDPRMSKFWHLQAALDYLAVITPNKPVRLLSGPAVKNSWLVAPSAAAPPPNLIPQS
jgi:hypothetical protein